MGEERTPLTDRSVVLEFLFWGIWPGGGVVGPSEKFGGASSSQFLLSPLFLFLSVSFLSLLPSLPQCRKLRLWGRDLTGRKSGGQISPPLPIASGGRRGRRGGGSLGRSPTNEVGIGHEGGGRKEER